MEAFIDRMLLEHRVPSESRRQRWESFCTHNNLTSEVGRIDTHVTNASLQEYDLLQQKYTSQSILVCPNCKSKNVSYVSKQIRRADESETYFCKCLECKEQWRFS